MKQQLLEQRQQNALACFRQALSRFEEDDQKHAIDYLKRGIALLSEAQSTTRG